MLLICSCILNLLINMRVFTAFFHKADYIFFLFTQLVNENCALHTAMVLMAHMQMFLIMCCLDVDQWVIHSTCNWITRDIPAVL